MNSTQVGKAKNLCVKVIDKIRDHYNKPYICTSGFRCPQVNELAGGVNDPDKPSQHTLAEAMDGYVLGVSIDQLFTDIITGKIPGLVFDQVIHEGSWVHISYREGHNRGQRWRARFTGKHVEYRSV